MIREAFDALAGSVCVAPPGVELVSLSIAAETSTFIRFNHGKVRQATHVDQCNAAVSVVHGGRRATGGVTLSGDTKIDVASLLAERDALAAQLVLVPEDKYLLLPDTVTSTTRASDAQLPSAVQVIDAVERHAGGTDFVGHYVGGPVVRAFADTRGQRNWHSIASFHFEWSVYRGGDQAVKSSYADTVWDEAAFAGKMARAREQVDLLARPRVQLSPGEYRVYFTPVAVAELLSTLAWGGFGLKSLKTGVSPLVQLHTGEAQLDASVSLTESVSGGIAPRFQEDGFVKPDFVKLVEEGRVAGMLASPRSAKEYGVAATGSNGLESPESLAMAPGRLPANDVLKTLGKGIYISNLHYLNYSDRLACRMTGMTRFACFSVEAGELVAPIGVMRFDDSFLRMFGPGLVALTASAESSPDAGTYTGRMLASVTAPGAIVEGFHFTL